MGNKPKERKIKMEDILNKIDALTVAELAELVKAIEEKYGVSAVAAAAPAAGGAVAGNQSCKRCNRIRIKRS